MKPGLCEMGCGRDATHPKSGLCSPCYSSCRYWQNGKTRDERIERASRLLLYGRRMESIDAGAVRIGTIERRKKPRPKQRALRRIAKEKSNDYSRHH